MLQFWRIANRAIASAQGSEARARRKKSIAGVHADNAPRHRPQQFQGVIASHNGVGWIVLHAEMLALGDGL